MGSECVSKTGDEAKAGKRKRFGPFVPATVKTAPPGTHLDNDGLYLLVSPTGARSWFLRVQVDGKRRDVGLGAADTRNLVDRPPEPIPIQIMQRKQLTLKEAREKAKLLREAAKAGLDPIAERDRERKGTPTFREAATQAHDALKGGWKGRGAATFLTSLTNHAFPAIGNKRVDQITAADITDTLKPIWTTKPDMARKVRQRIGKVLDFAHGKGWRASEAPGKSVTVGLQRQPKGKHYKAMPYDDVPAFVASLTAAPPTRARQALILHILTAARPGEVRQARWGQFDLAKRDWHRPAEIMKGVDPDAHTVTLSSAAVDLLTRLKGDRKVAPDELVFTGIGKSGVLSDTAMRNLLRKRGLTYDIHAFRSSFRDWAADKRPDIPDAVAEVAIAHSVGNKVVRAYKRTQFIEMRRDLLEAWGAFVTTRTGDDDG